MYAMVLRMQVFFLAKLPRVLAQEMMTNVPGQPSYIQHSSSLPCWITASLASLRAAACKDSPDVCSTTLRATRCAKIEDRREGLPLKA